ncbi:MAG: polysaccharide deacetylase family protein [Candidatus Zipacnadales bacterium]
MVQSPDVRFWPNECEGAVSLTFDDGLPSQLRKAIPMLNDHGLAGTFYLSPQGDWRKKLAPWVEHYQAGHEIGNHTLSHTCSRGFRDELGASGLETLSLANIEADVVEAERRLSELFPRPNGRSFCYPCWQSHVGEGATRQSYVPIVAKHFIAGRGLGEWPNHPLTCDLHYLWSWDVSRMTGATLVGLAERCASMGRWGLFVFHGIDEGHLPVATVDFLELCRHLQRHAARIWTAPVADIARWVLQMRTVMAKA